MTITVLARTRWGLEAGHRLLDAGQRIGVVATAKAEDFYKCDITDYERLARRAGAVFIDASNLSEKELAVATKTAPSRIAISVNWPRVLRQDLLDCFPLGVLNAHAGDLPRYRGNACPNWAILNGEAHVGLCVHLMEAGSLDSGPVVLREHYPLGLETGISEIYDWLGERIPVLLADGAIGLLDNRLCPTPQSADPDRALRCYPRRPEDGRIHWQCSAFEIHRLIRASGRPFAGAFSFLSDGRKLTIWKAQVFSHPGPFCAVPGQIMMRVRGAPVVACGEGCLLLQDVEVEGLSTEDGLMQALPSLRARLT